MKSADSCVSHEDFDTLIPGWTSSLCPSNGTLAPWIPVGSQFMALTSRRAKQLDVHTERERGVEVLEADWFLSAVRRASGRHPANTNAVAPPIRESESYSRIRGGSSVARVNKFSPCQGKTPWDQLAAHYHRYRVSYATARLEI